MRARLDRSFDIAAGFSAKASAHSSSMKRRMNWDSQGVADNRGIKERTGAASGTSRRGSWPLHGAEATDGYLATIGAISPSSGCLAPYGAL